MTTRKDQEGNPIINDEFESAFAEATGGAAQDTESEKDATLGQSEEAEAHKPEGTDADTDATGEGEAEGKQPEEQGAETEPQQPQKPVQADRGEGGEEESVELWRQRYMSLQGKFNKLVAQQQKPQQADKPAQGEQDTGKADPAQTGLDEDDAALLAELDNELPVVGKAIRRLLDKQSKTILQKVEERVAPVAQTVQMTEEERHFAAIYEAHEDFDEIVSGPQLYEWVDSQPSYIQSGMRQVLAQGTASEVIDLFTRFKEAAGRGKQQESVGRQPPESDPILERRRKQLEDAGAVRSRASAVTTRKQAAVDDFDAAFAEAASRTD